MSDLTIRWFRPEDYGHIHGQEAFTVPYGSYPQLLHDGGLAVTWTVEGKPVAATGLVRVWPHSAEAWAVVNPSLCPMGREFHYSLKRAFCLGREVMRLNRVQTYVDARVDRFIRWVEVLGYRREARLKCWGPGQEDYFLYAWVRH